MLRWSVCACCVVGMMSFSACKPEPPQASSTPAKTEAELLGAAKPPAPPKADASAEAEAKAKALADKASAEAEEKAKEEELPKGAQWIYAVSVVKGDLRVEHSEYSDKEPINLDSFEGESYGKLLPPQTDKLPKTLTMLKGYELLLADKRLKADRVKGWIIEGGAGRTHIYHVLELPEGLTGTLKTGEDMYSYPALAIDMGRLGDLASYENSKAVDLSKWKKKTQKAQLEVLSAQIKEVVRSAKPFAESEEDEDNAKRQAGNIKELELLLKGDKWLAHVKVFEGSFEEGSTQAISFAIPRSQESEDGHISGIFFANAAGEVTRTLYAPYASWEGLTLKRSLDVDGDGTSELLYESFYYEGSHTYLLKKGEGGVYKQQLISGDGA